MDFDIVHRGKDNCLCLVYRLQHLFCDKLEIVEITSRLNHYMLYLARINTVINASSIPAPGFLLYFT